MDSKNIEGVGLILIIYSYLSIWNDDNSWLNDIDDKKLAILLWLSHYNAHSLHMYQPLAMAGLLTFNFCQTMRLRVAAPVHALMAAV